MEDKTPIHCWFAQSNVAINSFGQASPCCAYYSDDMPTINEATAYKLYHSQKMKSIRNNLRNGVRDVGCSSCWKDEDSGITSMRQVKNYVEYKNKKNTNINVEGDDFLGIEIVFGNICNMKCRHCSTRFSSRWKTDDELLGRYVPPNLLNDPDIDDLHISEMKNLSFMKFWGGEPYLSKSHDKMMQQLHSAGKLEGVTIECATNGSIFPNDKMIQMIKKVGTYRIIISIEDYGEKYDYFRTGGDFITFKENIKKFIDLKNKHKNIEVWFHLVVTAMNLYRIDDVIEYYLTEFPECDQIRFDRIRDPEYLRIEQWDTNTISEVIERINKNIMPYAKNIITISILSTLVDTLKSLATRSVPDFSELFRVNDILDKSRETSLCDVHPIFQQYR